MGDRTSAGNGSYFCEPDWHSGRDVGAIWFVRAWDDTDAHKTHPNVPERDFSTCSHHLGRALAIVTHACSTDRPFIVLRNVRGM